MLTQVSGRGRDFERLVPSKRIALVLGGTYLPHGGMVEYARAWRDQLRDSGWGVTVIAARCILNELDEPEEFALDSADTHWLDYRKIAVSSVLGVGRARRLIDALCDRLERASVCAVHIVDRALFTGYLAGGLKRRYPNIQVLVTVHDPVWHEERIGRIARILKKKDDRCLVRMAAEGAIWIHVHSDSLVAGSVFEAALNVIQVAHPSPRARTTRTRRRICDLGAPCLKEDRIRVGFIGRIEPYKGLDILLSSVIDAIGVCPGLDSRLEVLVAGKGDVNLDLIHAIKCPVYLRNEFISDADFHQIIADLDLLVLPYRSATQSGVGMLGLTYKIPMIVTNIGGLPGLVVDGETGYVLNRADSGELSKLLVKLCSEPEQLIRLWRNMSAPRH